MANLKQVVYLTQADYAALLNDTHDPKQYTKNGKTIYFDPNTLYITESTVSMSELEGILPVGKGGTGVSTLASGYALIGNGTSPVTTRGIRNNTSAGALGWTSSTVDNTLVTTNTLAYWNGAYTGTTSNISKLGTITNGTWQATVIGAAYGGTGQNTLQKSANALINALDTGTSDLTTNDYIITQYVGGGTSNTTYYRRAANKVVNSGLVKAALGTNSTHGDAFLRKDGTWQTPPYPVTSVAGKTGAVSLVKGDVGLGNVDNTADANKTVLALTNFKVSKYTIPDSKGVRITYPSNSPVLISCQRSLSSGRLILIGGGYGAEGGARNNFRELVSPSTDRFTWSLPNSASISCSVEIMNNSSSSGNATVWVWASDTCTFTEITALTTEAMNASLLTTASTVPWSKISSTPTTISGYGITDAKIASGVITLGSNTISSQAAANGGTTVSLVTTGEKYIWNSKTSNTGTVTSITLKAGTGISLDTDNTAITTSGTRTISNTGVLSIGGLTGAVTLADLGLSQALRFIGITSTALSDGATTATLTAKSTGSLIKTTGFVTGDVVIDTNSAYEYVWTGSAWERLGGDSSYKTTQTAVSDPTASGNTTSFIDTISQNTNGVITATKKTIPAASDNTAGIMKLGASGGAATYGHTHTLSIADGGSSDTNQKTLAASTKYKLTAGGSTYVFTTPPNTTSFTITANATDGLWDLTGTNGTNAVTYALAPYSAKDSSNARFYTEATNPTLTTRLNYDGYFYATKLYSGGTEVLTAHQTYTSFTGKPTSNQTPSFGGTFTIQQISQNTSGQVSGTDRTVTIPSTIATNTAVGLVKPWYTHTAASTGPTTGNNATAVTVNAISTTAGKYYAVEADSNGRLFVNVPWSDNNTDTQVTNTLNTSSKYYFTGTTSTSTNTGTQIFDTGVYSTAIAGELSAVRHSFNLSGTEKAYVVWNDTDKSLDFIFV